MLALAGSLGIAEGGGSGGTKQAVQNPPLEIYSITTEGIKVTYTQADADGSLAIYATKNGRQLWLKETIYCSKSNQDFPKGFQLISNDVIAIRCLVNSLPQYRQVIKLIHPKAGIFLNETGNILAIIGQSIFIEDNIVYPDKGPLNG